MDEMFNIFHSFVVTPFDIFRRIQSYFWLKNGANVISNDIKPTKIQNAHFNKPDAAFMTMF